MKIKSNIPVDIRRLNILFLTIMGHPSRLSPVTYGIKVYFQFIYINFTLSYLLSITSTMSRFLRDRTRNASSFFFTKTTQNGKVRRVFQIESIKIKTHLPLLQIDTIIHDLKITMKHENVFMTEGFSPLSKNTIPEGFSPLGYLVAAWLYPAV